LALSVCIGEEAIFSKNDVVLIGAPPVSSDSAPEDEDDGRKSKVELGLEEEREERGGEEGGELDEDDVELDKKEVEGKKQKKNNAIVIRNCHDIPTLQTVVDQRPIRPL